MVSEVKLEPRPYQLRALAQLRASYLAGRRRPVLVSPAGSGKSCMGAMLAANHVQQGGRVTWFAHRRELLEQAGDTLRGFGLDVGFAGLRKGAPVQLASVQTVLSRGEVPDCSLAIADEAHHLPSKEWRRIVEALDGKVIVGLTATPERADGIGLGELFDDILVVAQISELVSLGHLAPLKVVGPSRLLKANQIAQSPVDAYRKYSSGSAIVFGQTIAQCEEHLAAFGAAGISAEMVTGATDDAARADAVRRFRDGVTKVLVNVNVLTEGFDAPRCDAVIVARGCKSQSLWIQMAARALRTFPGKNHGTLIDLRGVCNDSEMGRPDADREYSLEGGIKLPGAAISEHSYCSCGALLDDVDGPCPECGKEKVVHRCEVTGDEIAEWKARLREDDDEQRIARLAKWIQLARFKRQKWQTAIFKFKSVYGSAPSSAQISAAMRGSYKKGAA